VGSGKAHWRQRISTIFQTPAFSTFTLMVEIEPVRLSFVKSHFVTVFDKLQIAEFFQRIENVCGRFLRFSFAFFRLTRPENSG
jgi:hypothetical protein